MLTVSVCEVPLPCLFTLRCGGGSGRRIEVGVGFLGICINHPLLPLSGSVCYPTSLSTVKGWHCGYLPSGCFVSRDSYLQRWDQARGAPRLGQELKGLQQHRHESTWDYWAQPLCEAKVGQGYSLPSLPFSGLSGGPQSCPCATGSGSWGKGWVGVAAGLEWPLEFAGSHCLSGFPTHFCTSFGKFLQL